MIEAEFQASLKHYPARPFVVCSAGQQSYAEFYAYVCWLADVLDELEPGRLCCHLPDSPELIALIYASALSGRSLALFNHDYDAAQLEPLIELTGAAYIVTDIEGFSSETCEALTPEFLKAGSSTVGQGSSVRPAVDGEILILTSGTTGQPKCACYQWSNLLAQVKKNDRGEERWLLAYRLNHFAGIQMIAHALCNGSTLVLADTTQVADMVNALVNYQVTHVSSTPTFWRFAMALLSDRQKQINLQHITLGSEAASGDLLAQLHSLFPDARIVHIYASTEAGSCVSVSDLKPGLPASILDRPEGSDTEFRIVEDELYIKSLNGMSGYLASAGSKDQVSADDGWRATGDLVRVEYGRIVFIGRKNETINVGGVKVHPLDVEGLITPLDGVKLARVYGRKNPVVGYIVAVEVVCNEGYEPEMVEAEIQAACKKLVPAAQPRSIKFVDAILTNNMKLSRK